ncbi:MAG: LysE family transporter [Rikenellaceae bacterium]
MDLELLELLLRSVMVGIVASITVGPVAVLCIQRTLSKSRRSGLISGLGVACADTVMAIAAFFFYSMLQSKIELYNELLRIFGGLLVVAVGVYIFVQNPVTQIKRNRSGQNAGWWQDFISVFGLTLANFIMIIPYILAFFAVFKLSGDGSSRYGEVIRGVVVCLGFFLGSISWWSSLAVVINLFRARFRPRHMLTINHVAGVLIGGLGVYTIFSTYITEYLSSHPDLF